MKVKIIHPIAHGDANHPSALYGRGIHDLDEELAKRFLSDQDLIGVVQLYVPPQEKDKMGKVTPLPAPGSPVDRHREATVGALKSVADCHNASLGRE